LRLALLPARRVSPKLNRAQVTAVLNQRILRVDEPGTTEPDFLFPSPGGFYPALVLQQHSPSDKLGNARLPMSTFCLLRATLAGFLRAIVLMSCAPDFGRKPSGNDAGHLREIAGCFSNAIPFGIHGSFS